MPSDRYGRGLEVMHEIHGEERSRAILAGVEAIEPDFARFMVESGFGDVYTRPGLDLRQRQLITIAALTTLGGTEPQLAVHVRGALNVGVEPAEIVEALFQLALYAGHPRALNAMRVAREVFEERGIALGAER